MKARKKLEVGITLHHHKKQLAKGAVQTFGHPHPVEANHGNIKTQAHHDFTVAHDEKVKNKVA